MLFIAVSFDFKDQKCGLQNKTLGTHPRVSLATAVSFTVAQLGGGGRRRGSCYYPPLPRLFIGYVSLKKNATFLG